MFHGDPTFKPLTQKAKVDLELLGMEARSILRSIRTEHDKLQQSQNIAQSDLHYFRARYNYYKLSLLRLDEGEKQMLEPVLKQLKTSIIALERSSFDSHHEEEPAPFLAPVEQSQAKEQEVSTEPVQASQSTPQSAIKTLESRSELEVIEGELQLVSLALKAEASAENNQTISQAVERVLKTIQKMKS